MSFEEAALSAMTEAEIRVTRGWPSERDTAADEVEAMELQLRAAMSGDGWVEPAFRAGMLLASRLVRGGR
jgi:hypothetical protein